MSAMCMCFEISFHYWEWHSSRMRLLLSRLISCGGPRSSHQSLWSDIALLRRNGLVRSFLEFGKLLAAPGRPSEKTWLNPRLSERMPQTLSHMIPLGQRPGQKE